MTVPIASPCDTGAFIARLGGDAELARQMAGAYIEQADRLLAAVRAGVEARDCEALRRAAHAMRGSAANFDAAPTVSAAAELEHIGRTADFSRIEEVFVRLEAESARFVAALREFQGASCES